MTAAPVAPDGRHDAGRPLSLLRAGCGGSPLQLLAVVGCLAPVGARRCCRSYTAPRSCTTSCSIPFTGSVERAAGAVLPGGAVNWLRVPTLLSGLLLLVFWPVVTSHSEGSYRFASGLSQDVFLARYLRDRRHAVPRQRPAVRPSPALSSPADGRAPVRVLLTAGAAAVPHLTPAP